MEDVNEDQKRVLANKIVAEFGADLKGKRFAVWGLAFKPDTDDMREATSVVLINDLLERGASVAAYDPVAINEAKRIFGEKLALSFASNAVEALRGADALVIVTEWGEFKQFDPARLAALMSRPIVFDGRNLFDPRVAEQAGLTYHAIGRR